MFRKAAAYPGFGDWLALAAAIAVSLLLYAVGKERRADAAVILRGTLLYPYRLVMENAPPRDELQTEMASLRYQLATANREVARCASERVELRRLRTQLDYMERREEPLLPARVLAVTTIRQGEQLILERGERHGLYVDQPLLGVHGELVGKVVDVRERESTAQTLRHEALSVMVRLKRTRDVGCLRWSPLQRLLSLEGIGLDETVFPGDTVVTSGHSWIFPADIRVGEIVSVRDDSTALVKVILVEPAADFDRLEEAFLLAPNATLRE